MINLRHNQYGAVTLILTTILFMTVSLLVVFVGNYGLMQEKITANQYRSSQAFEAADAGLEYAIPYLKTNSSTVLANPVNGYISYTLGTVTLANNSTFTVVYSNPTQNNYNLIKITSTGASDDGTSTRTVTQQVQFGSLLKTPPTIPMTVQGDISLKNNALITNQENNSTINSGAAINISNNAATVLASGISSTSSHLDSDVQQNNAALSGLSQADFFATYLSTSLSTFQNVATLSFTNSSDTTYSSDINGVTGASISINQTSGIATIDGLTTVGTAASPVVIVVNGNLEINNSAVIYGLVIVINGTLKITNNAPFTGGILATNSVQLINNANIAYSSAVLTAAQQATGYYAKIGGSWKDF